MFMVNYGFCIIFVVMLGNKGRKIYMKWLCLVGIVVSLVLQLVLVDDLFGNYLLMFEVWDVFVIELFKKMIVDEKIGQLCLISVGLDNLKEVICEMIKDGQVGVIFNIVICQDICVMQDQVMELSCLKIFFFFVYDVLYGQCMVFLISFGLVLFFNFDVVKMVGCVFVYEAVDDGLNMIWVLMVDVLCDLCWGCVFEGFGEDMYFILIMGKIMVEVMQGKSLVDCYLVMISVKYFVVYGVVEGGKEYNIVDMSLQCLFNDYMLLYKVGLDVGSGVVMVVLNLLNGMLVIFDFWLLKDVLCDQWGFKGIIVFDYGVIKELIKYGMVVDLEDVVCVVLKFGINMSMSDEYYLKYLFGLIKFGKVMMVELDDVVCYVLNVKYDMGLFNDLYSYLGLKEFDLVDINVESCLYCKEVCEVVCESLVLLKNCFEMLLLKKLVIIVVVGLLVDSKCDVMGSWFAVGVVD